MNTVLVRCIDAYPKTDTVTLYKFGLRPSDQEVSIGQHVTLATCDDIQVSPGAYTVVDKLDDGIFVVAIKKTGRDSLADVLHQQRNLPLHLAGVSDSSIPPSPKLLLLCGGVGITPAIAVLCQRKTLFRGCDIHVVVSVESLIDLPFLNELLDSHFSDGKVKLNLFVTRSTLNKTANFLSHGRINAERLSQICPDLGERDVHIFGPESFVRAMQHIVHGEGHPPPATSTQHGTVRVGAQVLSHDGSTTLLDLCEDAGITIPNRCRMGICGSCKVTLQQGNVSVENAVLSQAERERGFILACCSIPLGDVCIEV